jgi:hypothetical protein
MQGLESRTRMWTKKSSLPLGKSVARPPPEPVHLPSQMVSLAKIQENKQFLRKLLSKQVGLVPTYLQVAPPAAEIGFARQRYQFDKVKITIGRS